MHIMYDNDNSILTMLHKNISQINTRGPFSKLEYFLTNATMQIFVKICPYLEVIAKKTKRSQFGGTQGTYRRDIAIDSLRRWYMRLRDVDRQIRRRTVSVGIIIKTTACTQHLQSFEVIRSTCVCCHGSCHTAVRWSRQSTWVYSHQCISISK